MKNKRMKPTARKEQIVAAALVLAETSHFLRVTRDQIADKLGITPTSITYHFGTMPQLRRDMMRTAVREERLIIIAQGLVVGDEHAKKADKQLRREAALEIV